MLLVLGWFEASAAEGDMADPRGCCIKRGCCLRTDDGRYSNHLGLVCGSQRVRRVRMLEDFYAAFYAFANY